MTDRDEMRSRLYAHHLAEDNDFHKAVGAVMRANQRRRRQIHERWSIIAVIVGCGILPALVFVLALD